MRKLFLALAGCFAISTATSSAALTLTFTEEMGNVVMRTSGSVDVSGAIFSTDIQSMLFTLIADEGLGAFDGSNAVVVGDGYLGIDLLGTDLTSGTFVVDSVGGSGSYGIDEAGLFISSSTGASALLDGMPNFTIYESTRELTWNSQTFASMGLDAHAMDTPIGLWAARAGATDAETINFVVSSGVVSIPEPSSSVMIGLGIAGFILRRLRA